jgi:phosphoglycolate phosphatase-like HAD superfamily hydrolase
MNHQEPQPGLVELMDYLKERGVKRALCTRNFEYAIFSFFHASGLSITGIV